MSVATCGLQLERQTPDVTALIWATPARVSTDLAKVVSNPEFKKKLAKIGSYSRAMTPEQVLAFVRKEQATWLPVLQKIKER